MEARSRPGAAAALVLLAWVLGQLATGQAGQSSDAKYDQMQLKPAAGAEPIPAPCGEEPDSGDLMRAIQKALTASRKADQRLRKLSSERDQKEKQWERYGAEMKAAYEKEFKKFRADMTRIDQDLDSTMRQGQEAAGLVKQLASGGLRPPAPAPAVEDSGWAALIANTAADAEMEEPDGFLRKALQARASTLAQGASSQHTRTLPGAAHEDTHVGPQASAAPALVCSTELVSALQATAPAPQPAMGAADQGSRMIPFLEDEKDLKRPPTLLDDT